MNLSLPVIRSEEVIPAGVQWSYTKGRTSVDARWRLTNFDDSKWEKGPTPFFYGEPFAGTFLADMRGGYTSIYLRKRFVLADPISEDPNKIGRLILTALSDDGFIAWINGKELVRYNVPEGELSHSANALPALLEPLPYEAYEIPKPWEILVPGTNVLTIQAFNSSLSDSSDFVLDARLTATFDNVGPTVAEVIPPEGATVDELGVVEVFFDEEVQGVDAGDLWVNGVAATEVRRISPQHYVFLFPQPATGTVEFRWMDETGITDVLGSPNAFRGGRWNLNLAPEAARKNLSITEFMASNDKTLLDDDKDKSDWIEIYNSGSAPVNLLGWSLTDEPGNLGKWRFPDYTLNGDSYLVVFASQKNKTNSTKRLHTNFKLDEKGDYLGLVAPDGEVVSDFGPIFPKQTRDISYGRVSGSPEKSGFFSNPTPGARNAATGVGFTPVVEFSRASGTFVQRFQLQLNCLDSTAAILYTLDGTFPSENNVNLRTYAAPILIGNTVQVRARAIGLNVLPSAPTSETFIALTNDPAQLASFTSSLPVIVMTTLKPTNIADSRNTSVHFSLYEPINGLTTLRSRPTLRTRGAAKTRGSSTGGQPQSNFAIEWWDEFDQDKDLSVLGMPADSEWVLYAPNEFDPPLIHNPFTMEISRQMESSAPRTRFVEVYLNKGGPIKSNDWFGVYVLMEKPGLSKGRINAPKARPEDVAFPEITGSYMFKTDRLDPGDSGLNFGGTQNAYVEPKEKEMKTPQRAPQVAYLKKYFADLDNALKASNPNWRDPILGYRAYIELTNWVDFHILETLSGQVDAIRLSTYFYKRKGGKIEYGPRWDYDRAWESKGDNRDDNPRVWDTGGGLFGSPWWPRVLADRNAWQLWIDRWQYFRQSALSQSNMFSVIDRMTNEVRFSQPREAKRWSSTLPRQSYPNEIRIMKTWISNRLAWIDLQMAQPPRLSSPGAVVTPGFVLTIQPPLSVSNPANVTIFYTLDGTDPRPDGGTNTPISLTYTGPITLRTNSRVVARVLDSGRRQSGGPTTTTPWSSSVAATFVVTPPALVLSELMFHPEPPPADSPYSAGDFEFVELKNISDQIVNLVGYHFAAGIDFRFTTASELTHLAPGERVVVVRNRAAFLARYPGNARIAGQFGGGLDDQGERLTLAGPVEEPIFDFTYDNQWRALSGGFGFSLVLADETTSPAQLGNPANWRLSASPGGSPGVEDPQPISVPHVKVNEVLSATRLGQSDLIELYNPESTPVDISGWWLSDRLSEPKKVRLPMGTRINALGFLLLGQKVFNSSNAGFGLSSRGDDVWLFSADAEGNLTGWSHGFAFGAADENVTFGRYESSTGAEHFVAQKLPSLSSLNNGPLVGPVIISEIMFHPPNYRTSNTHRDEFIELRNVGDKPVSMFDPLAPTNTWRLRGGVAFDFPTGVVLPPNGNLVVVGFKPLRASFDLDAFRAVYGLDDGVRIFGPWAGALDTGHDVLRLLKPGIVSGTNTTVGPHILVEQVNYSAVPPWPVGAAGTGSSIVRRDVAGFADDPSNWSVAIPTPGDTDADADGLPDDWERANGLDATDAGGIHGGDGDPDNDGFSNRQEYFNRTGPRLASSSLALRVYLDGGGVVNFTFAAASGRSFSLQTRSSLGTGDWQTLRSLSVPISGVVQATEFASDSDRYFRLVAE